MPLNSEKTLELVKEAGVLRPRELARHGIPRTVLTRLTEQGRLRRIGRGLYELADAEPTEHLDLVEVCKRVAHGVVCLISALHFHELTTQMPHEVWLAVGVKSHKPRIDYPPVRVVRFSTPALTYGTEVHRIQGVEVRLTSPAKTVADCFKYRNKIGTDVAVEALRDYRRARKGTLDDLWAAAKVCRVTKVIRPYLEALA